MALEMSRISSLLWLTALLVVSVSKRRPFRSVKAPSETVETYGEAVPEIAQWEQGDGRYPKFLDVVLDVAFDEKRARFSLLLERNDVLLPLEFISYSFDDAGNPVIKKGVENCYYQGKVREEPEWQAVVSLCRGLQGTFGIHSSDTAGYKDLFHVELLNSDDPAISFDTENLTALLTRPHAVYPDTEFEATNGTCGSHHGHQNSINMNLKEAVSKEKLEQLRAKRQSDQQFLFVELVIVNDNAQYIDNSRNLEKTMRRACDIANQMDSNFRVLNVRVVLVEVITWSTTNEITIVNDAKTLLYNFRDYVGRVTVQHDALMLLTGIDLTGLTIGIAFIGTMCSSTDSVGVTQDTGNSEQAVGATASHELGHIMNMQHDDRDSCNCPDGMSACIMAATISSNPPTSWSQCSVDNLYTGFTGLNNLDRCLFNKPTTVVSDVVCGNGIQEDGETCDCGSPQKCTSPCCNPRTCQLVSGAQCFSGTCCDLASCQFHPYGTECRASSSSCDIAEYCSGEAQDCPVDTSRRDGTSCSSGNNYCFDGACQTLNSQCQFHFATTVGNSLCFTRRNGNGNVFGNCGYTQTDYIACESSDVNCGMLFCASNGQYQWTASADIVLVTVYPAHGVECLGFTPEPGADIMSPGLVADGTRCGNGFACYSQQCIPVGSLPTVSGLPACPIRNRQACSGNGVCNNLGGCSCNVGYTGNDCSASMAGRGVGPVNECATRNGGCEHICVDTEDSFTCLCNMGYRLNSNRRSCNDINECSSGNGGCQDICINTIGSFWCSCHSGFILGPDGFSCVDLDECVISNGLCAHNCDNTEGSFFCSCRPGFILSGDGRTCDDVDECANGYGGCAQVCINLEASYTCKCLPGFELDDDNHHCKSIFPCTGSNNCGHPELCSKASGSPVCSCRLGFSLGEDEKTCSDLNECATSNGGCSHTCTNTVGAFTCSCPTGFVLRGDFHVCTDFNECARENGGCSDICTNMNGTFTCSCPPELKLGEDKKMCVENTTGVVSGGSSSGVNGAAIAGGVIAALLAVALVIGVILLVWFLVWKKRAGGVRQKEYTHDQESRENLISTTPSSHSLSSLQCNVHRNQAYSGYQPPTMVCTDLHPESPPPADNDYTPAHPPATPVPLSPSHLRRAGSPSPQHFKSVPMLPPAACSKPTASTQPKPPKQAALTRPQLSTKLAAQPLPSTSPCSVPPLTMKPPPLAKKSALQSRPPPTSKKPSPAVRPLTGAKPSPVLKPHTELSAPSGFNIQWAPPYSPSQSSSAPLSTIPSPPVTAKKPITPAPKIPMIPPKL